MMASSSWARMHDGGGSDSWITQAGNHTPAKRLTDTCSLSFIVSLFDIRHPCYSQLTPGETRYLLTSITWPYHALKFRAHWGHSFLRWPLTNCWFSNELWVHVKLTSGRVVWKPINTNPGLKVNWSVNLSCIQRFF